MATISKTIADWPLKRRVKNGVIYRLVIVALAVLRRLPLSLLQKLGRRLGALGCYLASKERKVALENLERVWPEMSDKRRRELVSAMFANMGQSALECLALPRLLADDHPVSFSAGAEARLRAALARGKGAIWVTAHFGNWELMSAMAATVAPVYVLAKQSYDPRFSELIERYRRSWGVSCIWVDRPGHLRQTLRALRSGAIVGILLDQNVADGPLVPFCGHPARTSPLIPGLVRATSAAVVEGFIYRSEGRQEIEVSTIELPAVARVDEDALARALDVLNGTIERAIHRQPSQWAWSLTRWRSSSRSRLSSASSTDTLF